MLLGTHGFSAVGSLLSSTQCPAGKTSDRTWDRCVAFRSRYRCGSECYDRDSGRRDASAGIHNADGSWTDAGAAPGLTLTSDGEVATFRPERNATVDGGDTATAASSSATLHVNVTPMPDPPTLTLQTSHVSGNEDQPIKLESTPRSARSTRRGPGRVDFRAASRRHPERCECDFLPISAGSILLTPQSSLD